MKELKKLRSFTTEELLAESAQCEKDLFELRNELSLSKKLEKPHLISSTKKKKARILTLIREIELQTERKVHG